MSKDIKVLRGQVRQIVLEVLPEVLKEELYKQLEHKLALRMEVIEKFVKNQMEVLHSRNKDTLSYIMRSVTQPAKPGEE